MNAPRRASALPVLAVVAALIACSPWASSLAPTPTFSIGVDGPRYLSAPPPVGYLLVEPAYEIASVYDTSGRLLEVLPDIRVWRPGPAAGAAASPLLTPGGSAWFAFLHEDPAGISLHVRQGPEDRPLRALEDVVGLCGSIPAGFIAVSDVVADPESEGIAGVLYLIETSSGEGAERPILRQPILPSSPRPLPLAIAVQDDTPSHVYYTLAPREESGRGSGYGYGLYLIEIATGRVSTSLDEANWILGVSPDQTFVAFLAASQTPPEVRIARLDGASTVLFQPLAGARRVMGAAFSPDSSRIAWASVVGESSARESWQLSLASTFGGPTTQVDLGPLMPPDQGPVSAVYPVAWVSGSAVLIQVERGDLSAVHRYQVDSGEWDAAGAGIFVSLLYP